MARIVIAAFGTRGDVVPSTDFGCRLQEAGHDVVLAAPTLFADLISGCGLQFRAFDVEFDIDDDLTEANPLKVAMKAVSPRGMRATGESLLAALHDVPAGRLATAMFDRVYGKTISGFREQLGLPRTSARNLPRRRTEAEWPILHGFSPTVVPRPEDWRSGLEVVGYWWPQRPIGWRPPDEVVSFLESGAAPVFLSFGSLIMTKDESARVSEVVLEALSLAGVRGVIQAGWAGPDVVDDTVLTAGDIPHDWLFGKVCAPDCRRSRSPSQAATAIEAALTDPTYRANAEQLATRIAEEDGAARVVTAVEKLVRA